MAERAVKVGAPTSAERHYRWTILSILVAAQAAAAQAGQGLPTMSPMIESGLRLTKAELGIFMSIFNSVQVASVMPTGWLTDKIGVRKVLPSGLALLGLSLAALYLISSIGTAVPALLLAGISFAVVNPACASAIHQWFSARSRGTAMSINKTGVPLTAVVLAATLPALSLAIGWRTVFILMGVSCLIASSFVLLLYREPPNSVVQRDSSQEQPLRLRSLLTNLNILGASAFTGVLTSADICVTTFLILYLRDELGLSVVLAGGFLAVSRAGALLGRPAWGVSSDAIFGGRRKPVLLLVGTIGTLSVLATGLMPATSPLWLVGAISFGLGLSLAAWHGVFFTLITEMAGSSSAGMAVGFSSTIMQTGRVFVLPLFGLVTDLTSNYRPAWVGLGLILAVATIVFASILREDRITGRNIQ